MRWERSEVGDRVWSEVGTEPVLRQRFFPKRMRLRMSDESVYFCNY